MKSTWFPFVAVIAVLIISGCSPGDDKPAPVRPSMKTSLAEQTSTVSEREAIANVRSYLRQIEFADWVLVRADPVGAELRGRHTMSTVNLNCLVEIEKRAEHWWATQRNGNWIVQVRLSNEWMGSTSHQWTYYTNTTVVDPRIEQEC